MMTTKRKLATLEVIANALPIDTPFSHEEFCEMLGLKSQTGFSRLHSLGGNLGLIDIVDKTVRKKTYTMSAQQKREMLSRFKNDKKMQGKRPQGSRSTMTIEERKAIANRESAEEILRKAGIFLSVRS